MLFGVLSPAVAFAEPQESLSVKLTINVNDNGEQLVSYVFSGKSSEKQQIELPIAGRTVTDLTIDGASIEPGAGTLQRGPLAVGYSTVTTEVAGNWTKKVSYKTTDLLGPEPLQTFALPALSYDANSLTESITITLPLSMGLPVAVGLQADDSEASNGKQTYFFKGVKNRTSSILFDFDTVLEYGLTWDETVRNNSWWWQDITVVLSPDTNQQVVSIESINPRPKSIRLNQDGNILLTYTVGPKRSVRVQAEGSSTLRSVRYMIDATRTLGEIGDNLQAYLAPTGAWANGEKVEGDTALSVAEALYDKAVEEAAAVSAENYEEFVNNLVADARASGVPARVVRGVLANNGAQNSIEPVRHWWAEFYLPGTGWFTVDPAIGNMYSAFASGDAYHVAEFIRGLDSTSPKTNVSPVKLTARELPVEEAEEKNPTIEQIKYVVLPGLSVVRTKVTMPAGSVADGLGYKDGDSTFKLGSLAPLQVIERWTFAFGADSWSESSVSVGVLTADGIEAVSESVSTLSFWALVYPLIAVGLIVGVIAWRRKRNNTSIKVSEADEDIEVEAEDLLKGSVPQSEPPEAPKKTQAKKPQQQQTRPAKARPKRPPVRRIQ